MFARERDRSHAGRMCNNRRGLILPLLLLLCCTILFVHRTTLNVDPTPKMVELVADCPTTESSGCKYSGEWIDSYIFNNLNLGMDDPKLLDYIRSCVLHHPDAAPYNLKNPSVDPSAKEGVNKVVLKLLQNKTRGTFVEAGANDGETTSNTLLLERNFGWTGLLVEPDSRAFEELKTKHRKAWMAGVCLSTSQVPQKLSFWLDEKNTRFSLLSSSAKLAQKQRKGNEVTVHCFPFYSLLLASNITTIDYVSLDIEGVELDVIKTIPFHKLTIRVMSVEFINVIRKIPGGDSEMKKLFESNGYRIAKTVRKGSAFDYVFAHSSVAR